MPGWRVGDPIQSQPAQFELDMADAKFLENNSLGQTSNCLGDVPFEGHASLKTTLINEGK